MTASLTEEDQGGVVGYDGAVNYSEYNAGTGGSRRRKGGKRGKRGRKSKKYMRRMYRGGNQEEKSDPEPSAEADTTTDEGASNDEPESPESPVGGRRRSKKMRKGKMHKGKSRKGKVSKWITHVKNFSRANKMDFRDALKDPKCKASYHKMK
jgi:hypothetical protein